MALHFLDFDYSEDEEGRSTWDAIASVDRGRLPSLLAEVQSILAWAEDAFGALQGPQELGGLWQYDLQCERAGQPLCELRFDAAQGSVQPPIEAGAAERVTISFSLSGGPAFAEAFVEHFGPQ